MQDLSSPSELRRQIKAQERRIKQLRQLRDPLGQIPAERVVLGGLYKRAGLNSDGTPRRTAGTSVLHPEQNAIPDSWRPFKSSFQLDSNWMDRPVKGTAHGKSEFSIIASLGKFQSGIIALSTENPSGKIQQAKPSLAQALSDNLQTSRDRISNTLLKSFQGAAMQRASAASRFDIRPRADKDFETLRNGLPTAGNAIRGLDVVFGDNPTYRANRQKIKERLLAKYRLWSGVSPYDAYSVASDQGVPVPEKALVYAARADPRVTSFGHGLHTSYTTGDPHTPGTVAFQRASKNLEARYVSNLWDVTEGPSARAGSASFHRGIADMNTWIARNIISRHPIFGNVLTPDRVMSNPIVGPIAESIAGANPLSAADFFSSAVEDPYGTAEGTVNTINHLWGRDLDGKPITLRDRMEGGLTLINTALLADGVRGNLAEHGRRARRLRSDPATATGIEELGLDPWEDWAHDWYHSPSGQEHLARFEEARKRGPDGSLDFIFPRTGVRFENGFARFQPVDEVRIRPTGRKLLDEKAANARAGYTGTPEGYTWHHHEHHGRMQLVPRRIHATTRHTGGWYIWGKQAK